MTDPNSLHHDLCRIWGNPPGWRSLSAVNHSTIGLRFMVTGIVFFLIGGVLAMLVRTQLALPEQTLIAPELYNQFFTMHGTVMMFLFAIPVLEGLAMYLIPKMIGTRDLAFPRIGALGYFCYLFGGLILCSSLILNMAPSSGWFMYTPLSDGHFSPDKGPDFWLLGITFVEISAISAGVELIVTILRTRAPGMTLNKMPIFCWYILAMAGMILFGFPPLILASIMLELERAAGFAFFDVSRGGDSLLWQHLFWLFGHPEVYIIFLPAAGIISTLIPVFAQRPLVGYRWVVLSIITMAFISFGLWVHHMFTVGIPQVAQAFFSVASMLVAVPTAIQIFVWLATLWSGRVKFELPMLWIMGFLMIFVCGGLTGVMLALVPFDWQVHDTHFVVAHMHYVLVGGMLFPLIAGLYYWLPHFSGRMPSNTLGKWGFWLTFIGFNTTFLFMHWTGLLGMPRRVYTYEANLGWDGLNLVSSIGGFIMAIGIGVIILDFFLHFRFGTRAPHNPWKADTLEWAMPTPPPVYNFLTIPTVHSRHPLWDDPHLPDKMVHNSTQNTESPQEETSLGLARAMDPHREIYGTTATDAKLQELIRLPGNTWLPFQLSVVLAGICISLLSKWYWLALSIGVIAFLLILRWSWLSAAHPTTRTRDSLQPPSNHTTRNGLGVWGMILTLMADASLYLSLVFGWFYLWTVAPEWQLPENAPISFLSACLGGGTVIVGTFFYSLACQQLKKHNVKNTQNSLMISSIFGFLQCFWLSYFLWGSTLNPVHSSYDATFTLLLYYLLIHSALAAFLTALQVIKLQRGYIHSAFPYELAVIRPLWFYILATFLLSLLAFIIPSL